MRLAIIGAGWAGMAAAVEATRAGHQVTVFEAARTLGGRARAIEATLPGGDAVTLDNGQHILIGAYSETLRLMQLVGVKPATALQGLPLTLKFPNGSGLQCPNWPAPLDALAGIALARGWPLRERLGLLRQALHWRLAGFRCAAPVSVAQLCAGLGPRVMAELIEPLCVSALNTPAERASAQVFLRVLQDALFGAPGSSHLLLPRRDLSALFPAAAAEWLARHGGQVATGARVSQLQTQGAQWQVNTQLFDAAVLATSASEAMRLLAGAMPACPLAVADQLRAWSHITAALQFEAITTVYAWGEGATLPRPLLALHSHSEAPAQFVFDRGQLGGPAGLLAFVISASHGTRDMLQTQVLAQARAQLGLHLTPVQTVVEKRATFACTPALQRPSPAIAPGLLACGDYLDGPYPATLEGAVRSGLGVAQALEQVFPSWTASGDLPTMAAPSRSLF